MPFPPDDRLDPTPGGVSPQRQGKSRVLRLRLGRTRLTLVWRPRKRPSVLWQRLLLRAFVGLFGVSALAQAQVASNALPTGGQVSAGSANIAQSGSAMTVTQSTPKAILNWNSFDIGPSASVTFNQPSRDAVALNRVVGVSPSQIQGQLNANGQIFLVNPQGILFGPTAQVNVGGLAASTLSISDADFLSGNYRFERNGSTASVVNQGRLTAADAGYIALLAPEVINEGVITARLGTVAMAAGEAISLDFRGDGVLGVSVDAATVKTLVENRQMVIAEGGTVYLSAKAAGALGGVMVSNSGTVKATSLVNRGGMIRLEANGGVIDNSGTLSTAGDAGAAGGRIEVANRADADRPVGVLVHTGTMNADGNGAAGGQIALTLDKLLSAGQISANGTNGGNGGRIDAQLTGGLLETAAARLSANGASQGGSIIMQSSGGRLFTSGRYEARGQSGGTIDLLGQDIALNGAALNASGTRQGGTIRIGGDWQGSGELQRAQTTYVTHAATLTADATDKGNGGKVVVWSEGQTNFYGTASARGGAQGGDGGAIEVSGKAQLTFGGMGDASAVAGKAGVLLLDPKNIVIDSSGSGIAAFDLLDPNPQTGGAFGIRSLNNQPVVLSNDNVVIAKPNDSFIATNAGAVYVFNGTSGALISTLNGSQASDQVGTGGIKALSNGNFVVRSFNWANGTATKAGAATWASGATGISGLVSSSNSLVGTAANDLVGNKSITALSNGNYVVASTSWANGAAASAGAATWGNGTSGTYGAVSSINSLVGSQTNDQVGNGGVVALSNGNYVVSSSNWANGTATKAGAATWANGTTGITGLISGTNSVIGTQANDNVGSTITSLSNDNYVISSYNWANGTVTTAGAVTWGNGTTGAKGFITNTNSLVGTQAGDKVGLNVTALTNGNFVVGSNFWKNGTATNAGAVTWASGSVSITGNISSTNSLVGTQAGDRVGVLINPLDSGSYVVGSYYWANGTASAAGAATWANGTSPLSGVISSTNSLVGTQSSSGVGSNFILLSNGNYLVNSPNWQNGTATFAGAITWGSGSTGITGVVSSTNSIVGTQANDKIGYGSVIPLTNGNYVIRSYFWNNGTATQAGAATWGNGSIGTSGTISSTNSLVGAQANDQVGHNIYALANGNYVVMSDFWSNGTATSVGAVTWGNGNAGMSGIISSTNSLLGSQANDRVGSSGIVLANGNYIVQSALWSYGTLTQVGAVTWANGSTSLTGFVSASNSFIGTYANDRIGSSIVLEFSNGNVLVGSSSSRSGTTSNAGRVSVIVPNSQNILYNTYPASDIYLNPAYLTKITNTGTALILQANNDITLNSAVTTSASGNGGALTLQAGRSVNLNASITTDNGNLTLIANDKLSSGVVDAYRDPGTAVLSMASGTALNAGTGNVLLKIEDGAGKTNKSYGNMTLQQVQGKTITATTPTGSNITLNGTVSATASGNSVVLAAGGNFVNNAGSSAINPGAGRYLVYSQSPLLNTLGGLNALPLYNKSYAADPPATITSSGSRFIYSLAPTLTYTANNASRLYGDANPSLSYGVSGLVGSDALGTAASGTPVLSTTATPSSNVGSYAISIGQGSLASDLGYGFAFADGTLSVTPAPLTITADNASRQYGLANPAFSASYSGFKNSDSASSLGGALAFSTAATAASNVGGYSVTPSGYSSSNYSISYVPGTLSITPAPITVSSGNVTKTYDGTTSAAGSPIITSGALYNGNTLSGGSYAFLDKNAGTGKSVTVSGVAVNDGNGGNNYSVTYASNTNSTITPKALTVSATAQNKVYDGTTAASVTFSDDRVAGDVLSASYAFATFSDKNAGTGKPVTVTGIALSGADALNYTANNSAASTADITPRTLTITANGQNKVYDGTTAATVALADDRIAGDLLSTSYGSASFADKHAGIGKVVTVSGLGKSGADAGNYVLASTGAGTTADITPAALTIAADDKSRTYGDANPALTASYTGLVGGDTAAALTGTLSLATSATTASNVGSYAITPSGQSSGDYSISYVPGTLTVTPATLTVTADDKSRLYGDANPAFSASYAGFRNGDTAAGLAGNLSFSTPANTASNVGSYAVTPSGQSSGNYSISYVDGTLSITPAPLTVTADNASRQYGLANPVFTASYSGFKNGDMASALGGTLAFSTAATAASNVGSYSVTPSGYTSSNYSISYVPGTLSITPAPITISSANVTKTYDGTTTAAGSPIVTSGALYNGNTLSGGSYAFLDKNAGTGKTVSVSGVTVSDGNGGNNYSVTYANNTSSTIAQKALTVTATSQNKVYDGTTQAAVTLADDRIPGDVLSAGYASATFADKNAGIAKTVTVAGIGLSGPDAGNYAPNLSATTSADITPKTLTVTATGQDKVYDGTTAAIVTLSDDRIAGDALSTSFANASFADKHAGLGKAITINGLAKSGADAGNYVLAASSTTASADVSPAPLSITADGKTRTYGDANPSLTATYSGLVGGDTAAYLAGSLSLATPATASSNVGSYVIVPSGHISGDYSISYVPGTLSITPAPLTVSADNTSRQYGLSNPVFTASYSGFKNGDISASLGGVLAFSTAATAASNVGSYSVTPSGYSSSNYSIGYAPGTLSVTPAPITVSTANVVKTYDGTTTAAGSPIVTSGALYNGNTLSGGSYAFLDKNAGTGKTVSVSGVTVNDGNGGGNYSVTYASNTGSTINPKPLTVTATGQNKTYDGTAAATVTLSDDRIAGDILSTSYASAVFGSKNAGANQAVTVSG
ncbi:filamentous hemagglutinin family N-terminal domain-containing protein, partial [Noviherbaspirillum humi]